MELKSLLNITEIIICAFLIISILLQQKEGGLGTMFGGASGGESYRSKRGAESFLTNATIVLAVLFVANSIAIAIL